MKKWVPLNVIEKRGSDYGHVKAEVVSKVELGMNRFGSVWI